MLQLLPSFAALGVALLSGANAYPFMMFPELLGKDGMKRSMQGIETDFLKRAGVPAVGDPAPIPFPDNFGLGNEGRPYIFDPAAQYVDLENQFPWQAPGPTDQRGPCAGLNALANHGLISRSGILTSEDVLFGIGNATGLSTDATNFLHATTTFFDGDPFTGRFSIGGYDSRVSEGGPLEGDLLGKPSGLCALGHLKSEGDASITRGDFTQPTGENSNCASYTDYFRELLDLARAKYPDDGRITPSVLAAHQNNRKEYSIANNPNYFSPPFAGVAFTPAAHHFAFAMMANHSVENPEGIQTPENLMSWFSYTGDPQGDLTYKYGYERIPAPWYKRHPTQPWTLGDIVAAVGQQVAAYPKTSAVGGNTGQVNSFAGIDVGDLTGGAYTSITELSDPAKMGCFLSENIQAEAPSFASNVFQGPVQQAALAFIAGTLVPTLVSSFGTCNIVLNNPRAKPMSDYSATYPGLTAGLNDQSRALSPSP